MKGFRLVTSQFKRENVQCGRFGESEEAGNVSSVILIGDDTQTGGVSGEESCKEIPGMDMNEV